MNVTISGIRLPSAGAYELALIKHTSVECIRFVVCHNLLKIVARVLRGPSLIHLGNGKVSACYRICTPHNERFVCVRPTHR